ncbi:MAG: M56 family metallopeptidase [Thermoplasmata archaeon]
MIGPLVLLWYMPVAVWAATGTGLLYASRSARPTIVLRLAAAFLALWALLATTLLVWVLANGNWIAILGLLQNPSVFFEPRYSGIWIVGALGAFAVFATAFVLNQVVGRGFLLLYRSRPIAWPRGLPPPVEPISLLVIESRRLEAFSFTLLEPTRAHLFERREIILVSRGLLRALSPVELEAVIAHELAHIEGLDSRYLTFFRTLARMMRWDPVLAYLARSLTRHEEFQADRLAVDVTRRPLALARALYKASRAASLPASRAVPSLLGAGGRAGQREVAERIRRLVVMAESGDYPEDASAGPAP